MHTTDHTTILLDLLDILPFLHSAVSFEACTPAFCNLRAFMVGLIRDKVVFWYSRSCSKAAEPIDIHWNKSS